MDGGAIRHPDLAPSAEANRLSARCSLVGHRNFCATRSDPAAVAPVAPVALCWRHTPTRRPDADDRETRPTIVILLGIVHFLLGRKTACSQPGNINWSPRHSPIRFRSSCPWSRDAVSPRKEGEAAGRWVTRMFLWCYSLGPSFRGQAQCRVSTQRMELWRVMMMIAKGQQGKLHAARMTQRVRETSSGSSGSEEGAYKMYLSRGHIDRDRNQDD